MKSVIPKNDSAEKAVIACLLDTASAHSVPLTEEHFAAPDHRLVFKAIRDLSEEKQPVTLMSVRSKLESRGELEKSGGDPSRFFDYGGGGDTLLAHHFPELENARRNREVVLLIHRHLPDLSDLSLPAAQFAEELAAISTPQAATTGITAAEVVAQMEADLLRGEPEESFPIGLRPLDDHLQGGLRRGELFIAAAATGKGKTALMVQCAATTAQAGHPVVIFSLEINERDILRRIAAASSGISPNHPRFRSALCDAIRLPVTIYRTSELAEILATIRTHTRQQKAGLILVDYMQLVDGSKADTRELVLNETARRLKNTAMREGTAIFSASQLNDQGQLHSCRAIAHHADCVMDIREDGITLAKFRRGPAGVSVSCQLRGALSRFESL
jgi:replicative DNA helicase